MNEIMKLLTLVGSIFIPLTFIAGIYGMNFQNMPELALKNGYWIALIFMALVALSMVFYFYKRGWFNKNS
jgi:magnesium transporter